MTLDLTRMPVRYGPESELYSPLVSWWEDKKHRYRESPRLIATLRFLAGTNRPESASRGSFWKTSPQISHKCINLLQTFEPPKVAGFEIGRSPCATRSEIGFNCSNQHYFPQSRGKNRGNKLWNYKKYLTHSFNESKVDHLLMTSWHWN